MTQLATTLRRLDADLAGAVERLPVPIFVIDRSGAIAYANAKALEVFGAVVGAPFGVILAPGALTNGRLAVARTLLASQSVADVPVTVRDAEGRQVEAELSAAPLERDGHAVAVFGFVDIGSELPQLGRPAAYDLTARQTEVLRHLAAGCTTEQIAQMMGISLHTARNHIRQVRQRLRAKTRLEAILKAIDAGLVDPDARGRRHEH
jgi:PAS domain S-box-containing protein